MLDMPKKTTIEQDRIDLAAAFRLAYHFDFHEGICNHFSVKVDAKVDNKVDAKVGGDDERYLINAYGVHW